MGELNPFLREQLEKVSSPQAIPVIVEFPESEEADTLRQLAAIPGASIGDVSFNMVRVVVPLDMVPRVAAIPGVIVHYDAPVGPVAAPRMKDVLLGDVALSSVTVPYSLREMPQRVSSLFLRVAGSGQLHDPSVEIVPMSEVRKDLCLPANNVVEKTKVAVLDTGIGLPHPAFNLQKGLVRLGTTIGPTPLDGLGHGSWCSFALAGTKVATRFGDHDGIADVRNGHFGSWKVLSDVGFGTSFSIIRGVEQAVKWGAKIISMSLGGPQQGSVEDDPMVRIIQKVGDRAIFVIAAGNSGPSDWTVGSPGIAPGAITVGAYSPVYCKPAVFSSRGPSGAWYQSHPAEWRRDLSKYGDDLFKPDVSAPGGGPSKQGEKMDLILSGVVGWTQPMYVLLPGVFGAMRGTSMSTPIAAGVIALAVEHGLVNTAADVRKKMARYGGKDTTLGYGMITYPKLV